MKPAHRKSHAETSSLAARGPGGLLVGPGFRLAWWNIPPFVVCRKKEQQLYWRVISVGTKFFRTALLPVVQLVCFCIFRIREGEFFSLFCLNIWFQNTHSYKNIRCCLNLTLWTLKGSLHVLMWIVLRYEWWPHHYGQTSCRKKSKMFPCADKKDRQYTAVLMTL